MKNKKGIKKALRQHVYGGSRWNAGTLCLNAHTNIRINVNLSIQNLQNLKDILQRTNRIESLFGLYTDINYSLGMSGNNTSHYGIFSVRRKTGSIQFCTLRISNHNSKAETYLGQDKSNKNISIVIRTKADKNKFQPSSKINLIEYCYFNNLIKKCPDLVIKIIDSILGYLSTGEFVDLSGVAKRNVSPWGYLWSVTDWIEYKKRFLWFL